MPTQPPSTLRPGTKTLLACVLAAFPLSPVLFAETGIEWEWRNPLPQGEVLWDAIQVDGTHLAVGRSGTILISDGEALEIVAAGTSEDLYAATWDGNRYLVSGARGTILTSEDGRNWSQQDSGTISRLRGIASSDDGRYVAVGAFGTILFSEDAEAWTAVESGEEFIFRDVLWYEDGDDSGFIAVGGNPVGIGRTLLERVVATSPDGLAWEIDHTEDEPGFRSIAWNGTYFLAADTGGVFRSADGIEWDSVSIFSRRTDPVIRSVTWTGSLFLAVGGSNAIFGSDDGTAWDSTSLGLEPVIPVSSVTGDGDSYTLAGHHGFIAVANDLSDWTNLSTGSREHLNGIARLNGRYVAVGNHGRILTSDDGSDWQSRESGTAEHLQAVTVADNRLLAVGNGGAMLSSDDGEEFSPVDTGSGQDFRGITWNGEVFVLVGASGLIKTSADGEEWTERASGTSRHLNEIAWNGSFFAVAGDSGTILTSPNAETWQEVDTDHLLNLDSIASDGDRFVAGGSGRNALTSTDGVDWTTVDMGVTGAFRSIRWDGTRFLAVGLNGDVVASSDGLNWEGLDSPTAQTLNASVSDGHRVIAVGDGGSILEGVFPATNQAFSDWLAAHFDEAELADPERTEPDTDPDGLGIPNLLRYAFALDPRQPEHSGLPAVGTSVPEGLEETFLTITFTRRTDSSDLDYQVMAGNDPSGWVPLDGDSLVETSPGPEAFTETVTYRDNIPAAESDRRFLKVRVSEAP